MKTTASQLLREMWKSKGFKQKEVAALIGTTSNNFNNRLKKSSFKYDEFTEYADKLGFEVIIKPKEVDEENSGGDGIETPDHRQEVVQVS